MVYCPVQVKITSEDIQKSYLGAKYLLQIWKRLGKKVYQRPLQGKICLIWHILAPVSVWAICFNYFLYKPTSQDSNSDYIHILDLKDPEKVYLVEDFTQGNADCID